GTVCKDWLFCRQRPDTRRCCPVNGNCSASASEHPCGDFVMLRVFTDSEENFKENLSINSVLPLTLILTHPEHGNVPL
ncbi:mCG1043563, partial [Mus musculus]